MATAKISEYKEMAKDASGDNVAVPMEPAISTQTVTFTTAVASAAFNKSTKFIRVVADAKAHFVVGGSPANPTASSPFLPANLPEYLGVRQGHKIKFYDGSS